MIHPQMATMLCFITTDARVAPETLQSALVSAVDETFNTITVDGDMSTNDTVIALANGASGAPAIEPGSAAFKTLEATLTSLCADLAKAIAADGEGASKLFIVDVAGVPEREMARDLARAVAGGSLVKSGIFGGDPVLGANPRRAGRPHRRARIPDRSGRRHARRPGGPRLRRRWAGGVRQGRPLGAHAVDRDHRADGPRARQGLGARARL